MTIIEAIQEVFEGIEPNGTFAFDSEVKGDAGERYRDKAVNTPFCLISPNVNGEATIVNSQFNDRLTLRVFFLTFIDDNWTTYADIEANIVEPMRQLGINTLTKVLYQYPSVVTLDETTNMPHTDIYKWGSGRHAGAMFTFSVKQKRELNLCTTPITFDINLSSGDNGTAICTLGSEDDSPFTVNKNTNVAFYADADAGWKFGSWLVNGAVNLLNPLALTITRNYTIVAQFVESLIKQLTIAVSGNGTTSPAPGSYDYDAGSIVPITAIENDADYVFDEFTINGTPTTDNPVIVTVNENTNVVAYFVIKWFQWVFSEAITKIVDKYYFPDKSPNANNVEINNTQVGNFNGSVWISYNMTGRTIASYEGAAVPTKTSDSRIDVTAGLGYSLTLDNGATAYYNEENEDVIFFTDGTSGTLENVVLANFWNTKSEFGTPGTVINGYSKYLINQSSGATAHLGLPDGSNVGVEEIINGGFDTDISGWVGDFENINWSSSYGGSLHILRINTESARAIQTLAVEVGKYYLIEVDVAEFIQGLSLQYYIGTYTDLPNGDKPGVKKVIAFATTTSFILRISGAELNDEAYIRSVSVKEITPIDLTAQDNVWSWRIKNVGTSDIYYNNSTNNTSGNGYMVRITDTSLTLFRNDAGVLTQLDTYSGAINVWDKITPNYNTTTGHSIELNDVEVMTNADTTYTESKLFTADLDSGAELSHLTYNGDKFDLINVIDNTGTTGVQKVLGIGLTDAKGNELEIPANVVSNSDNTYDGIEGLADGATYEDVYDTTFDEETKTTNKTMGYVSEIKVL